MKLVKITLNNFGIYESKHELPLSSQNDNKLTLIIGKNGSGKTTLLNAVRTAFYGSLLFKVKSMTPEYQNYITEMLNKNALRRTDSTFYVEITFISNILGSDGLFTLKRSWYLDKNNKTIESIQLAKNGRLLEADTTDEFFAIFHKSYPIELFDLFFFDGEKIDQLSILNQNIVNVLETAFNLNLYKSLKNDLEKYALSKSKSIELKHIESKKINLKNELIDLKNEEEQFNDQISEFEIIKTEYELKINELKDSGFAILEDIDQGQLREAKKELDELNKAHRLYITDIIPYTLLRNETKQLITQLNFENQYKKYDLLSKELNKINANEIKNKLKDVDLIDIDKVLTHLVQKYSQTSQIEKIHDLTSIQFFSIKQFEKKINTFCNDEFKELNHKINIKRKEIYNLKQTIFNSQTEDYKSKLNLLIKLQSTLTSNNDKLATFMYKRSDITQLIQQKQNEYHEVDSLLWKQIKAINADKVIIKANLTLEKYIQTVRQTKLESIQTQTLKMFNNIIRKENFIKEIKLDDHSITFKDYQDSIFTHQHLSAGERQIFTLSLLVSILKTTERVTPLVFDTLLGRLDYNHKIKLLDELIKYAPDQIIILATDSEIDSDISKTLKPWINSKITIDLSATSNKITIEEQ